MTRGDAAAAIAVHRVIAIVRVDPNDEIAESLLAGGIRVAEISFRVAGRGHCGRTVAPPIPGSGGRRRDDRHAPGRRQRGRSRCRVPHLTQHGDGCDRVRAGQLGAAHPRGLDTHRDPAALRAGAEYLKLFPARAVGPQYIGDILAPFPAARLIPTGGVDIQSARSYIDAGAVAVAVGSAIVAEGSRLPNSVAGLATSPRASERHGLAQPP